MVLDYSFVIDLMCPVADLVYFLVPLCYDDASKCAVNWEEIMELFIVLW